MQTWQQISFIAAHRVANVGVDAATMPQPVEPGCAGESWLIDFPNTCDKASIPHHQKQHYGLACSFTGRASCFLNQEPGFAGSAHFHQP